MASATLRLPSPFVLVVALLACDQRGAQPVHKPAARSARPDTVWYLAARALDLTQCTFRYSAPFSYFLPFRRSQRPCFGCPQFRDVTALHVGCWLLAYILALSLSCGVSHLVAVVR